MTAQPLEKQVQVAPVPTDLIDQAQEQAPIPVWQRQPGEPLLWYNRFHTYRDLGYKRSLVAALAKEQENVKVLESPKLLKKPGGSVGQVSDRPRKNAQKSAALVEVPKPKAVQVPGSWKLASIKYNWVERAAAYDEYRIDKMVEGNIDALLEGPGTSFHRVQLLKVMLENVRTTFSTYHMEHNTGCMMIARMQSLIKQIADEMAVLNVPLTRAILRHQDEKKYQEFVPMAAANDQLRQEYEKIIEQEGTYLLTRGVHIWALDHCGKTPRLSEESRRAR